MQGAKFKVRDSIKSDNLITIFSDKKFEQGISNGFTKNISYRVF